MKRWLAALLAMAPPVDPEVDKRVDRLVARVLKGATTKPLKRRVR